MAKERRRALEEALKAGKLPALVATASLELGIDMGLVELVCQVESPRAVGRASHRQPASASRSTNTCDGWGRNTRPRVLPCWYHVLGVKEFRYCGR